MVKDKRLLSFRDTVDNANIQTPSPIIIIIIIIIIIMTEISPTTSQAF